ncbi:MAG: hypothetical protein ACE360_04080 [Hyphomicrobiales bacterium]
MWGFFQLAVAAIAGSIFGVLMAAWFMPATADKRHYSSGIVTKDGSQLEPAIAFLIGRYVMTLVIGIAAFFGAAGYFVVESVATQTARDTATVLTAERVVDELLEDQAFTEATLQALLARFRTSVVAFHSEDCPDGWVEFDAGEGRFLVGAGPNLEVGTTGGRADMPLDGAHQHERELVTEGTFFGDDNPDNQFRTAPVPGHTHGGENRPPFVALRFCEFEGPRR